MLRQQLEIPIVHIAIGATCIKVLLFEAGISSTLALILATIGVLLYERQKRQLLD